MKPKSALMVAATVTAIILVMTGAFINSLMKPTPAEQSLTLDQAVTIQPNPVVQQPVSNSNPPSNVAQPVQIQPIQPNPVVQQPIVQEPVIALEQPVVYELTADEAANFAVQYLGGGNVVKVEREFEHGQDVYDVRFDDGTRVYVDSFSGEIVYVKSEQSKESDSGKHEDDNKSDDHDD